MLSYWCKISKLIRHICFIKHRFWQCCNQSDRGPSQQWRCIQMFPDRETHHLSAHCCRRSWKFLNHCTTTSSKRPRDAAALPSQTSPLNITACLLITHVFHGHTEGVSGSPACVGVRVGSPTSFVLIVTTSADHLLRWSDDKTARVKRPRLPSFSPLLLSAL